MKETARKLNVVAMATTLFLGVGGAATVALDVPPASTVEAALVGETETPLAGSIGGNDMNEGQDGWVCENGATEVYPTYIIYCLEGNWKVAYR